MISPAFSFSNYIKSAGLPQENRRFFKENPGQTAEKS